MTDPVPTRRATQADAADIAALIGLYVAEGTLLPRSEAFVAAHAADFVVVELGGRIVGCAHLDEYAPSLAELRSLAVAPNVRTGGVGTALVRAVETLARTRGYTTLFAVSNRDAYFLRRGYVARHIPELDRERSAVSRFKGVFAKEL